MQNDVERLNLWRGRMGLLPLDIDWQTVALLVRTEQGSNPQAEREVERKDEPRETVLGPKKTVENGPDGQVNDLHGSARSGPGE